MLRSFFVCAAAWLAAGLLCQPALAQTAEPNIVVQRFVHSVLDEDYSTSWSLLTRRSKDYIIDSVSSDEKLDRGLVANLFETNDKRIVTGFWTSFRTSIKATFDSLASQDPQVAAVDGDSARVQFAGYKLQWLCFREGGVWRLGLAETLFPAAAK